MTKAKVIFFFALMLNNLVVRRTDSMSLETQEQNRELKGVFGMEDNISSFRMFSWTKFWITCLLKKKIWITCPLGKQVK